MRLSMINHRLSKLLYFVCILFTIVNVFGLDSIELKDGSVINGEVMELSSKQLTFKTNFAGTIKIKISEIKSFTSDKKFNLALSKRTEVQGKVTITDGKGSLSGDIEKVIDDKWEYDVLWPEGSPDPRLKNKYKWLFNAAFDYFGKTGNSEEINFGLNYTMKYERLDDNVLLYAKAYRSEVDGELDSNEYVGGLEYEIKPWDRHALYFRSKFEQDEFEDLRLRQTYAAGYGHYLWDQENKKLRFRTGLLYRTESYYNSVEEADTMGLDLGLYYLYKFKFGTWVTELSYEPSLEDKDDFIMHHESRLDMPLRKHANIRMGIEHDYDNALIDNSVNRLDTKYFISLVFTWD